MVDHEGRQDGLACARDAWAKEGMALTTEPLLELV